MRITISFELDDVVAGEGMAETLVALLSGENPVKARKPRKPRPEMSDEEKAVFRARMVAGQAKAAKKAAKEAKAEKSAKSKK